MTVLLTTHYMEEAGVLSDRVALMHHGHLQVAGTPVELKRQIAAPGDTQEPSLEDTFRHFAGSDLAEDSSEFSSSCRSCAMTAPSCSPGWCSPRCGC